MLSIENICKVYLQAGRQHVALNNVSLNLKKGQVLGLVGESGAGKSTLGRCILGLERPDQGRIDFMGVNLTQATKSQWHGLYPRMQMIFQDPYAYLNPYMRIGRLLEEPLENFTQIPRGERKRQVTKMLDHVGLPTSVIDRHIHQISGGQCQRVAIARALIIRPELLVCDEVLSAQDAPLQLQILKLLRHLIEQMDLTCLFITHDLIAARYFCSHIAVIRNGRIVEQGETATVLGTPEQAYTRQLVNSSLQLFSVNVPDDARPAPPNACVSRL